MKKGRLAIVLLLMVFTSFTFSGILSPTVLAHEDEIRILSLDDYNKTTVMGESTEYLWSVYSLINATNTHIVFIDASSVEYGWETEIGTPHFEIDPGESQIISLTVTSPDSRDHPNHFITVTLNITDPETGYTWTRTLNPTYTEISGGEYVPPTRVFGLFDNFLPEPLDNEWGVFILSILFWVLIGVVIFFVLDPLVKAFTKKTETELDDQILAIVKGPVFGLIVAYGLISSLKVLDFPWSFINGLELLYALLIIVLVSWMAFKILKDVLLIWGKTYSEKTETTMDDIMLPLFEKVGMVIIVIIAIIATLNLFGVDVTMLLAGMGVLGLVIAFAAQDTLGNFISGMFRLTDRPFKVGDLVLMENGDYCRVEQIGMRSTKLYNTFDHDVIILPNSKIANEKVINLTEPDNQMKVRVAIGVAYDTDLEKAKKIMLDVANTHPDVLQDEGRQPFARTVEFGDSAITLKIYTWVNDLDNQWRVASEIREAIFKRFNATGIEIPFPQRVLHIENDGDIEKDRAKLKGDTPGVPRRVGE
jgi:small-conductance mechanosensitive channel